MKLGLEDRQAEMRERLAHIQERQGRTMHERHARQAPAIEEAEEEYVDGPQLSVAKIKAMFRPKRQPRPPKKAEPTRSERSNFSEWLKNRMGEENINVKELSQKSGVSEPAIYLYRSGSSIPKSSTIRKLSGALNADYFDANTVAEMNRRSLERIDARINGEADESLIDRVKKYGITVGDYFHILSQQNHSCAICGEPFLDNVPFIDHCHVTGHVRGLLCKSCNAAIGLLRGDEDPRITLRASFYVSKNFTERTWWAQKS